MAPVFGILTWTRLRPTSRSRTGERQPIGGGSRCTADYSTGMVTVRRQLLEIWQANAGRAVRPQGWSADARLYLGYPPVFAILRRDRGLTATPYRRDKLDDLIGMQVVRSGTPSRCPVTRPGRTSPGAGRPAPVLYVHPSAYRYDGDADPSRPGGMTAIYRHLS